MAFLKKNPALILGLHLLLGAAFAIDRDICYLIPFFLLWPLILFFSKERKELLGRAIGGLLVLCAGFFYTLIIYPKAEPATKQEGMGYFQISSLKKFHSPFHRSFQYSGNFSCFTPDEGKTLYNIPCSIFISKIESEANCDYILTGTLIEKEQGKFSFKPKKNTPWKAVANTFSFAKIRYIAKENLSAFIKEHIPDKESALLFIALATGDIQERILSFEFGKLGLSHILAISGFHFALLSLFAGFILGLFLPPKAAKIALFFLLSIYFFFLGNAPSVLRAYVAISAYLFALVFHKRNFALNALGLGLIAEILIDPKLVTHLGFQLSFLSTFAILLLYVPIGKFLEKLLPKRTKQEVALFSPIDKIGSALSSFIRNSLALNFSVLIAALIPLLYIFHKFPLLSILYNLFFPLGITFSLFLFLSGCFLMLLSPTLGELLLKFNSAFTSQLLQFTSHPPAFLEFILRTPAFPLIYVILFLSLLFFFAAYHSCLDEKPFPRI